MTQTIDRPRTRRTARPTANDLARELLRELDRERTEKRIKTKGQVYFLRAYEGRHAGLVKIGTTVDLANRIATLRRQVGRCDLLLAVPGHRDEEAALHRQFDHLRQFGEWFRFDNSILEHVMQTQAACVVRRKR